MHYHQTTITPRELGYIRNLTLTTLKTLRDKDDLTDWEHQLVTQGEETLRWVGNVKHELWTKWKELPDGDHLKETYRDLTWTWDDSDLYQGDQPEDPEDDVPEVSLLNDNQP